MSGFSELCLFTCEIITTIKYSSSGEEIWRKTYGNSSPGVTDIVDMKIDNECNVYITGQYHNDAVTIKYDSSGNQKWVNTFSIYSNGTIANSMVLDKDNNIIISGQSVNGVKISSIIIKYSPSGVQQWARIIKPNLLDTINYGCNSVVTDKYGSIYISGLSMYHVRRLFLTKYTSSGDSLWTIISTDSMTPPISFMNIDSHDNIYLAGTRTQYLNHLYHNQIVLIKFDTSGILLWKYITDFPISTTALNLKVDKNSFIYLSAIYIGNIGTLKYSQIIGVNNIEHEIPITYKLFQNYPNPFNPATSIKYYVPIKSFVKLSVYDLLGQEITVLVNKNQIADEYNVDWDASDYPSGVYFYRLTAGDYSVAKKMVLIK